MLKYHLTIPPQRATITMSTNRTTICESTKGTDTAACGASPQTSATITATLAAAWHADVTVTLPTNAAYTLTPATISLPAGTTSATTTMAAVNNKTSVNTDPSFTMTATTGDPWVSVPGAALSITITDEDTLAKPTGFKLSVDGNNIQANWTQVTGATGYKLQYNTTSATAWASPTEVSISGGATVTRKVTSATQNTTYYFRLIAVKTGYDDSTPSDVASTTTKTTVAGTGDYDADNDGLIEVSNLAQLNAIRWDLDGNGQVASGDQTNYDTAFPNAEDNMGCNESQVSIASNNTGNPPCTGYELSANLDFDTGTAGDRTDDTYYNSGAGWTPIGDGTTAYTGDFSGKNGTTQYTITNLHVNLSSTSGTSYAGLFGNVGSGAEVENVVLTKASVTGSTTADAVYAGALAGKNSGTITESWSLGAVTAKRTGTGTDKKAYAGGLVGWNDGTIRAAYSRAAVTASSHDANEGYAGGLVGLNDTSDTIEASYATGAVTANRGTDTTGAAANDSHAGGLVAVNKGTITASYAVGDGTAVGLNTDMGGLVAENASGATITASYSLGKQTATTETSGTGNKGGLAGNNSGTITDSYWDTTTSGITATGGGTGKTTTQLKTPTAYGTGNDDIYKDWNVNVDGASGNDDPWDFGTSSEYPVLDFTGHTLTKQRNTVTISLQRTTVWERADTGLSRHNTTTITATLANAWEDAVVVTPPAAVSGLYTLSSATISIAAGSTTGNVTLTAVDDATDQTTPDSRSISLTATAVDTPAMNVIFVPTSAETIIVNDDDNVPKTTGVKLTVDGAKMRVDWTAVTGASGYKVQWATANTTTGWATPTGSVTKSGGNTVTHTISSGLTANTTYYARVITVKTGDLDAPPSDVVNATTKASAGTGDYDLDNDGLIEVSNLAQLNAMRWDLDGDGQADKYDSNNDGDYTDTGEYDYTTQYAAAFPGAEANMGCNEAVFTIASGNNTGNPPCTGYELRASLDFDTDGDGSPDSGDTYWNSGAGWDPIGGGTTAYTGKFDGNSDTSTTDNTDANGEKDGGPYTISNLFIDRDATSTGSKHYAGLFGRIDTGAEIKNVKLTGVSVTLENNTTDTTQPNVYAGGLVGHQKAGTITGSSVRGTVKAVVKPVTPNTTTTNPSNAGGLVGYKEAGDIISSYARVTVTAEQNASAGSLSARAGGLVGHHAAGNVIASYATGKVSAKVSNSNGSAYAGGLVGEHDGGDLKATYSYAAPKASNAGSSNTSVTLYAGGLVAHQDGGNITASYSTGAPTFDKDGATTGVTERKGGLVGYYTSGTTTDGYWDTGLSGVTATGQGTGKTASQLTTPTAYGTGGTDIYKDWDIDLDSVTSGTQDGWNFGTASQYPVLKYGHTPADQRVTVTFSASPTTIWERALSTPSRVNATTVTATLSEALVNDVTVTPPTADAYTLGSTTITITAGQTTGTVTLTAVNNRVDAANLAVNLATGATSGDPRVGFSSATPTFTINDDDSLAAPGNLRTANQTATQFEVQWDRVSGDASYNLQWKLTTATTWPTATNILSSACRVGNDTTKCHHIVTITAGSHYDIRVETVASTAGVDNSPYATIQAGAGIDYDTDDDGFIEVSNLAQLNAIRWDLDADGAASSGNTTSYATAFPSAAPSMGCVSNTCNGYELRANLDFNTDGSVPTGTNPTGATSGDTYWNSGTGWEPIGGTAGNAYTGGFDGNMETDSTGDGGPYKISNLYQNWTTGNYVGLFAFLETSGTDEVWHVALENVDITLDNSGGSGTAADVYVGALAGRSEKTDITRSYTTGTVTGKAKVTALAEYVYVGGLVGRIMNATIQSSYSWADVDADVSSSTDVTSVYAGGLVGLTGEVPNSSFPDTTVTASWAAGNVTAKAKAGTPDTGTAYAGGLVGAAHRGTDITASYSRGNVSATGATGNIYRGALVGYIVGTTDNQAPSKIEASFATGKLSGTAPTDATLCGLVGDNTDGSITKSYYDSSLLGVTGCDSGHGTGKTTTQLQTPTAYGNTTNDIYQDWNLDFNNDTNNDDPWDFGTASQYPVLKYAGFTDNLTVTDQRPVVNLTLSPTTIYEAVGGAISSTVTITFTAKWNHHVTVHLPPAADKLTIGGSNQTNGILTFTPGNNGNWGTQQSATVKLASDPGDGKTVVVDFTRLSVNDPEVSPKYLTFTGGTSGTWDTAQTINVKFLSEPAAATTRVSITKNSSNVTTGYKVDLNSYRLAYDMDVSAVVFIPGNTTNSSIMLTAQNDYDDLPDQSLTLTLEDHPTATTWIAKGATDPTLTINDDDELGQVTGVTAVQKTDSVGNLAAGATVSWTKVTGATGYVVEWKSGTQIYDSARRLVAGDVATYDIPAANLTPGTTYDIRVYATKSGSDHGLPSDEVSATYKGWLVFDSVPASSPTVQLTALSVNEPDSGTATKSYTVKLSHQPAASVTLNLSRGSGSSKTSPTNPTFSPSTLTFSTTDWDTAQTVTVTVTKDTDGVDDVVNIRHLTTTTGADFSGVTATLKATEIDNNDAPTSADFTRYVHPRSTSNKTSLRPSLYFPFTDTDTPPDGMEAVIIESLPEASRGTLQFYQRRIRQGVSRTTPVQVGNLALTYVGDPGGRAKVLYFYPSDTFNNVSFTYRVKDKSGNISDDIYTVTLSLIGNVPGKPSGFSATGGNEKVTLKWTDPTDSSLTGYQYQQRTAIGLWGNWTKICLTSEEANCPTKTSFDVTGLENNTAYLFRIRASNAGGNSVESTLENAVTPNPPATPDKPEDFTATGSATGIALAWTNPNDSTITEYELRQREQEGNLTALPGSQQVTLSWDNPHAPLVRNYQYRYKTDGAYGGWTSMPTLSVKNTSYTVTGLTNDALHTFQVRVIDAFPNDPIIKLKDIGTYQYAVLDANNKVTLVWPAHANSSNIRRWEYRQQAGAGNFTAWTTASNDGAATSWPSGALTAGTSYIFEVRPVFWTTGAAPASSTWEFTALASGTTSRNITWTDPNDDYAVGYQVRRTVRSGAITPDTSLSASNVGITTATLTVGAHSGQWWYQANAAPHNTCQGPVAAGTSAKDLTGLSAGTAYTYTAYDASGCASADEIATAGAFTTDGSISNLASTRNGDSLINGTVTKQAVAFTTGSNAGGYTLKTVTIPLKNTSGSGGLTVTLHAMQGNTYDYLNVAPSSPELATLTGTAPTSSSYTNTTWTCSGSGCNLEADTTYFIVANRTGSANYAWNKAGTENETRSPSNNGWNIRFAHDYVPGFTDWSSTGTNFNVADLIFAHPSNNTGGSSPQTVPAATTTTGKWTDIAGSNATTTSYGTGTLAAGSFYIFQIRSVMNRQLDDATATPSTTEGWTDFTSAADTVSHTPSTVRGKVYAFQVRAVNSSGAGVGSPWSHAAWLPAQPTGLTTTPGDTNVTLAWTAPSPADPTIDKWQYQQGSGGTWKDICTARADSSCSATTSYTVTGLTNGSQYTFAVRAVNETGNGPASDTTAAVAPGDAPTKPAGFTASGLVQSVKLDWTDANDTNITSYDYRQTQPVGGVTAWVGDRSIELSWHSPGDTSQITKWQYSAERQEHDYGRWADIPNSGPSTNSYTLTSVTNGTLLNNGTTYKFRVRGVGTANTTGGLTAAPENRAVMLSWSADSAVKKRDYRYKASGGQWSDWNYICENSVYTSTCGNAGSVRVPGLTNGTQYTFQVRNMNDANPRAVVGTLGDATATPFGAAAPRGGGTAAPSATGGWTSVSGSSATTVTHTVSSLTNDTLYGFQVRARRSNALGPASDIKYAIPLALPAAPTGLTAVSGENASATLSWPASNVAASWEYTRDDGTTWTAATPTTVGTNRVFRVDGLTNGTQYTFKIRAINGNGQAGPASDGATATPRLSGAPTGLAAAPGDQSLSITWTDPSDSEITHYEYRVTLQGVTATSVIDWTTIPGSDDETVSHALTSTLLVNGTAYDYHLRAVTDVQTGVSAKVTVTPDAVPEAPGNLAATIGGEHVKLTWDPPTLGVDIDYPFIRWEYRYRKTDSDTWSAWTVVNPTVDGVGMTTEGLNFTTGNWDTPQTVIIAPQTKPVGTIDITLAQDNVQFTPSTLSFTATDFKVKPSTSVSVVLKSRPSKPVDVWIRKAMTWVNATETTVTGLTNNAEYTFEVRSVNASGDGAAAQVTATPNRLPAAPTNLSAWGRDQRVVLAWGIYYNSDLKIPDPTITSFQYQKRTKTGNAWDAWGSTWTTIQSGDLAPVPYQNSIRGLTNGTEYQFRIRAVNPRGAGSASEPITATPRVTTNAPQAPSNVRAVALDGKVLVTWTTPALSWDANSDDTSIVGYKYRGKLTSASWPTTAPYGWSRNPVGSLGTTGLQFDNRTNGTSYDFQIRAVNYGSNGQVQDGAASATVSATPTTTPVPGAPSRLTAAPQTNAVKLTWGAPRNAGITSWQLRIRPQGSASDVVIPKAASETHKLYWDDPSNSSITKWQYSTDGSNWTDVSNSNATTTSATITATSLNVGNVYVYQVRGFIAANNTVAATNLQAWTQISTSASYAEHTVTNLRTGLHTFSVRAVNGNGVGGESSRTTGPLEIPAAPSSLVAEPGHQQLTLSWHLDTDRTITNWQYRIYGEDDWTTITRSDAATRTHTLTGLTNGKGYLVQVRAVNAAGDGVDRSVIGTPSGKPDAPVLSPATAGNAQVTLTWTAVARATGYEYNYRTGRRGDPNAEVWTSAGSATTVTVTNLTNDTEYEFRVRATNADGTGLPSRAVKATPSGTPLAPTNLAATAGDTQVTLSWSLPSYGSVTGYQSRYKTTGSYYAWVNVPNSNRDTTNYTLSSLSNNTLHTFQVRAVNAYGSGPASTVTATPLPAPTGPARPANFSAAPGDTQITLSWDDPSNSTITKYQVKQDAGAWTDVCVTANDSTCPTKTSHTVTQLTNGQRYTFWLRAVNSVGIGAHTITGVTPAPAPSAPTGLTATAGDTEVVLKWTDPNDSTITEYEYKQDSGDWTDISDSGATTTTYTVTGLTNGTSYGFRVRAVSLTGNGAQSAEVSATPRSTPGKPTGFTATVAGTTATLKWTAPASSTITKWQYRHKPTSSSETGYTDWADMLNSTGTTVTYNVTGLNSSLRYTFQVRAVNVSVAGPASDEAGALGVPAKPSGFQAHPGPSEVTLQWNNANNLSITSWEYKQDSGEWTTMSGSSATTIRHKVTGLTNGTSYSFKIRAVNDAGNGAESDSASATPLAAPGQPTNFTAAADNAQVALSWTPPVGDTITGWELRQRLTIQSGVWGQWTTVTPTGSTTKSHTVTTLTNNTSYSFQVRARNASGAGTPSVVVQAVPVSAAPAQPTSLATWGGNAQVKLGLELPGLRVARREVAVQQRRRDQLGRHPRQQRQLPRVPQGQRRHRPVLRRPDPRPGRQQVHRLPARQHGVRADRSVPLATRPGAHPRRDLPGTAVHHTAKGEHPAVRKL